MGSGLILFVIVGAWLAVLVPMFLRSHDAATSHRSADRFSDAMRVLSHRSGPRDAAAHDGVGSREVLLPRRPGGSVVVPPSEHDPYVGRSALLLDWLTARRDNAADALLWLRDVLADLLSRVRGGLGPLVTTLYDGLRHLRHRRGPGRRRGYRRGRNGLRGVLPRRRVRRSPEVDRGPSRSGARPAATPAARRRRTLLVLLVLAVATLVAALIGPIALLAVHVACDLVLLAFLVHLRRQAIRRAARGLSAPQPVGERPLAVPATVLLRVAGVPDRMPVRPAPLLAPAARHDDVVPQVARRDGTNTGSTLGSNEWQPIPVPLPTYVGKSVARSLPPRVLDLTGPGQWSADQDDDQLESDDRISGRRAANDW